MKNTDLDVKILLQKCYTEIMEKIVLKKLYRIVVPYLVQHIDVPLFGAAYAAPNKGTTIL